MSSLPAGTTNMPDEIDTFTRTRDGHGLDGAIPTEMIGGNS